MSFSHLFRYGRSLTPAVAASKAARYLGRLLTALLFDRFRAGVSTFPDPAGIPGLAPSPEGFSDLAPVLTDDERLRLEGLADNHAGHRFDLLGSGWVEVRHGMSAAGFEGHRFPACKAGADRDAIVSRLSPGNRALASAIGALVSPGYTAIDWQIDFRSGYRWHEDRSSTAVAYGHEPGVDVKVPWELARLQHLPALALAARIGAPEARRARRRECRDQIIDFISANPPGYGVNWHCTMDVAIRAANMAMTYWLLGSDADMAGFEPAFCASLAAHGRHIMANLENRAAVRGNHYLADVCGLAFVARALQETDETTDWWRFAKGEVLAEIERQFHADGGNFEGSTCYHRLSAEMAAYTVALILGRDGTESLPDGIGTRLHRMARFTADVTKPSGLVVQIGDNDSGRFFKLGAGDFDDALAFRSLDHGALITAIDALLGTATDTDGRFIIEHSVVAALTEGRTLAAQLSSPADRIRLQTQPSPGNPLGPEVEIRVGNGVLEGLAAFAYPDFGLYVWKSPRLFMSVRCGPLGQNGHGGHDHNDQLAIELQVDGVDWLTDPGSYTYSADPMLRDAYRSVMAHAAPRHGSREPASLALGMFRLEDTANARCIAFDRDGFLGFHHGFGTATYRAIRIEPDRIRMRDLSDGGADWEHEVEAVTLASADEVRRHFDIRVPFSPGYGIRVTS
jgi:hypothetical protein